MDKFLSQIVIPIIPITAITAINTNTVRAATCASAPITITAISNVCTCKTQQYICLHRTSYSHCIMVLCVIFQYTLLPCRLLALYLLYNVPMCSPYTYSSDIFSTPISVAPSISLIGCWAYIIYYPPTTHPLFTYFCLRHLLMSSPLQFQQYLPTSSRGGILFPSYFITSRRSLRQHKPVLLISGTLSVT